MKKALGVACVLMVGVVCAGPATWTGAENGFWTNANNWVNGEIGGRWMSRDAGGTVVTNGDLGGEVTFGAIGAGAASTINMDGHVSASRIVVTGGAAAPAYTFGTTSSQHLGVEALGEFCVAETADTPPATVACELWVGVESMATNYGGDITVVRNNSSQMFSMPSRWGNQNKVKSRNAGSMNEFGFTVAGTGDILISSTPFSTPNLQMRDRMTTGVLKIGCAFTTLRQFYVDAVGDTTTERQIEILPGATFRHAAGYYAFLTIYAPVRFYGEGELIFAAGWNRTAKAWKYCENAIYYPLKVECKVSAWNSSVGDPGLYDYLPGLYSTYGNGSIEITGLNNMTGDVKLVSASAGQRFLCNTLGLRGTQGSHGWGDFLMGNGAVLVYTGAGETTDRTITITNRSSKVAVLEQAGTGTLTVNSSVVLAANATGATLVLANDTEHDGVFAAPLESSLNVTKRGSGRWILDATNTYTGATVVEGGTLCLGPGGSIASSSGITLQASTALEVQGDAGNPVAVTLPQVTVGGYDTKMYVGAGCTVTISSFSVSSGALDIVTEDGTAQVILAGASAGDAPNWLTINGKMAQFDANGVISRLTVSADTEIAVYGGKIPDDSSKAVGITTVGNPANGPITLADGLSAAAVDTLAQKTGTDATVDLAAGDTLTASRLYVDENAAGLTIGSAAGQGTLKAAAGAFMLLNDSTGAVLSVKSALDHSDATKIVKGGDGDASIEQPFSYSGELELNGGNFSVTPSGTQQNFTLTGAGNFVKEGTGDWKVSANNASFRGDYVVRGGTVAPGVNSAESLFGAPDGGALVITNGATLDFQKYTGTKSVSFGKKEVRISGDGPDGLGAIRTSVNENMTPFSRLTFDGDASMWFCAGTKLTTLGTSGTQKPLFNMNGHTWTRNGQGRWQFGPDTTITNAGHIVLSDENNASGDNRNFLVFTTVHFAPEGCYPSFSAGNGARIILPTGGDPFLCPIVITGTNMQMGVFGQTTETNAQNWAGPVTLSGANALLELYAYGDHKRTLTVSGPISGEGSLRCVASSGGRYRIDSTANTYSGTTTFRFPSGSGYFCSVRFAGPASIPDFAKASFNYYGTVNVPFNDARADAWTIADVGRLLRTATFQNEAMVAIDTSECGSRTVNFADLGDLSSVTGSGLAHYGPGDELTLRFASDTSVPEMVFGCYAGHLILSGSAVLDMKRLRISSERDTDDGTVTIRDGLTVRPTGDSQFGTHDDAEATLCIGNGGTFAPSAGGTVIKLACGGCTRSVGVVKLENGGSMTAGLTLGSGATSYGGMFVQNGGTFSAGQTFALGYAGTGYWEMNGGTAEINRELRIGQSTNTAGLVLQTGGTVRHLYSGLPVSLGIRRGYAHFRMTGGTFSTEASGLGICQNSPQNHDSTCAVTIDGPNALLSIGSGTSGVGMSGQTNGIGVLNLNAGVVQAPSVARQGSYPGASACVNFNGGTFKAAKDNTYFTNGIAIKVGPGGGTFDTDGHDATISENIEALSGNGVADILWTSYATNTFPVPPAVRIDGDGIGATAVVLYDVATKKVTGLRITSPGSGYTWATAKIWYGSSSLDFQHKTRYEWTADCVLAANDATGGFTKTGAGTLTLSGSNTYTGDTVVAEGTLRLGSAGALPSASTLVVKGGTVEAANGVPFPSSITFGVPAGELDENRIYVLANFPNGRPATLPEVVGLDSLPPGWELSFDNNQLRLYYARGTIIIFR